jgi:metallophosphoesterase (TIGR00282 family)
VKAVTRHLPGLRDQLKLDLVVANAENAADGSGLTQRQFQQLTADGLVDALTMGDHVFRRAELTPILQSDPRIIRPANFPASAPGKCWTVVQTAKKISVAVTCALGRVFMRPVDCPFMAMDRVLNDIPDEIFIRLVDFHAEATSDKQLMAHYLDGRVTAVFGTHTHVPTADARVSPAGTAAITDVGMTGPYASIIGRAIPPVLETALTFQPQHYHVAVGDVRLCGAMLEVDPRTGKALSMERFEFRVPG